MTIDSHLVLIPLDRWRRLGQQHLAIKSSNGTKNGYDEDKAVARLLSSSKMVTVQGSAAKPDSTSP